MLPDDLRDWLRDEKHRSRSGLCGYLRQIQADIAEMIDSLESDPDASVYARVTVDRMIMDLATAAHHAHRLHLLEQINAR